MSVIIKDEIIDYIIEDKHLLYHPWNAMKYISRVGKKDPGKTIEDLKKDAWYSNRYIRFIEKQKEDSKTCRE